MAALMTLGSIVVESARDVAHSRVEPEKVLSSLSTGSKTHGVPGPPHSAVLSQSPAPTLNSLASSQCSLGLQEEQPG